MRFLFFLVSFLFINCTIAQKLGAGVTDVDGNNYKTVIIGNQEWMGENLKTTKYNDGVEIFNITDSLNWVQSTKGAWVYYNNDSQFNEVYGKLYNGYVIQKQSNVCPVGWHIPKALEWKELVDFLGGDAIAGEKLKEVDTLLWYSPYEASKMDIQSTLPTNTSLFSARPGGVVYNRWGFDGMRWSGFWWGADPQFSNDTNIAYLVVMNHSDNSVQYADKNKKNGFSIRCLKDQIEGSVNSIDCEKKSINGAVLEQIEVSNVTIELPYKGGNGGYFDKQEINSNGVTGLKATLEKGKLKEGDSTLFLKVTGTPNEYGTASFDINFLNQSCKIELTVERLEGKYGEGVIDVDGNFYKTVIIGNQEWMGENLKVSKYNDGTDIVNVSNNTEWLNLTKGAWCNYNNDNSFDAKYGKLYNWFSVNSKMNGNKNLCPNGWHVPSKESWQELIDYIGGEKMSYKLKDRNWDSSFSYPVNSTLFTALPAGYIRSDAVFVDNESLNGKNWSQTAWWTSSSKDSNLAWFGWVNFKPTTGIDFFDNNFGLSIRCLRNLESAQISELICDSIEINGYLTQFISTKNVTFSIPYLGGNGGLIDSQIVSSKGVLGLKAILLSDTLLQGEGLLKYEVSGTPVTYGNATFDVNVGGKKCSVNLNVCNRNFKIDTVHSCSSYLWRGKWLIKSGNYSDTIRLPNACDTVLYLHFNLLPYKNKVDSITACDPYQWHDSIYSASGTYTFNYVNTNGCPLTDTLVLMYSQPLDLVITGGL